MRFFLSLTLIILMTSKCVFAQTTAPAVTQPQSVLVLPFTAPEGDAYQWVGRSMQQLLAADLVHGSTLRVVAPAGATPAIDADAALKSASDTGAGLVVFGQTQVLGKEIRLTGQVVDATTGRAITGLKATGPIDQLFHLEDAVASQSLDALPNRLRDDEWRQRTGYASEPQTLPAPSTVYDQGTPPSDNGYSYSYPSYSYPDYSYPAYSYPYDYPYSYYGSGLIIFGRSHDHDFDRGRSDFRGGFHGNGFSRGFGSGFSGGARSITPSRGFSGGGFRGGGGFGGGGFHGGGGGRR